MNSSQALRIQLAGRAENWALLNNISYYKSLGHKQVVLFEGLHNHAGPGNFHPLSWDRIINNSEWVDRLKKPHQKRVALPEGKQATAFEM